MPDSTTAEVKRESISPAPCDKLIRQGAHEGDDWVLSRDEQTLPESRPAIVPLALWRDSGDTTAAPWLASDVELDGQLAETLSRAPLIAIDFPSFTDGRGYTLARLLRERFGYGGEIRAIGDVLIDQLYYMHRCGFDAMALRDDQDLNAALRALSSFSVSYQPAVDMADPLFLRRKRERAAS